MKSSKSVDGRGLKNPKVILERIALVVIGGMIMYPWHQNSRKYILNVFHERMLDAKNADYDAKRAVQGLSESQITEIAKELDCNVYYMGEIQELGTKQRIYYVYSRRSYRSIYWPLGVHHGMIIMSPYSGVHTFYYREYSAFSM